MSDELECGLSFVANRKLLLGACQVAIDAVPSKEIRPILQNFRLVAQGGILTVEATDLEIAVKSQCPIAALGLIEGVILIPADRFVRVLKELECDDVQVEGNEDESAIIVGKSRFNFPSTDPKDFPTIQDFPKGQFHEIGQASLSWLIRRACFSAGKTNEEGFTFASVKCEVEGSRIRFVTTSGIGLSYSQGKIGGQLELPRENPEHPLLPPRAIKMLGDSLDDTGDEMAQMFLGKNEVQVKFGPNLLYTRLVEGRFPKYELVIDTERKKGLNQWLVAADRLLARVNQANCMTDANSKALILTFKNKELSIHAGGGIKAPGAADVFMEIDYTGPEASIKVPGEVLAKTLKAAGQEVVRLEFKNDSFLFVSPETSTDERDFLYIIATLNK